MKMTLPVISPFCSRCASRSWCCLRITEHGLLLRLCFTCWCDTYTKDGSITLPVFQSGARSEITHAG